MLGMRLLQLFYFACCSFSKYCIKGCWVLYYWKRFGEYVPSLDDDSDSFVRHCAGHRSTNARHTFLQCNSAASHVTDGLPGVGTIDVVFAQTACRLGTLGKQEHASAHCSHASGIAYKGEL